jgi:hypothetical protein
MGDGLRPQGSPPLAHRIRARREALLVRARASQRHGDGRSEQGTTGEGSRGQTRAMAREPGEGKATALGAGTARWASSRGRAGARRDAGGTRLGARRKEMEGERIHGRARHGWNSVGRRSARNMHDWASVPGSFGRRAGARSRARRAKRATAALEKKEERLSAGGRDKEKGSATRFFSPRT